MGYRSEVAIAIDLADKEKFESQLEAGDLEGMEITSTESSVVYHEDWVKWYESYPAIQRIEKAMRSLENYYFIRIGEDYEDIEVDCAGHGADYGLYVNRSVGGI